MAFLEVKDLEVEFQVDKKPVIPLKGVSFEMNEGEVLGIQHSAPTQYDGPGEGVLQLPDVAGPIVGCKTIQGFRGETSSPSVQLPADPGQQVFGEERDVPLPLPQGREMDFNDF